jgi:hypothetical protein
LELAKRREADPIMFLYRGPDEAWCYEFWAILTDPSHDRHGYRFGNTLIEVKPVEPRRQVSLGEGRVDLQFDDILIELKCHDSRHRSQRGGFVIMPRGIYQDSNPTD